MKIIDLPSNLQQGLPFLYPAHQKGKLIEEYALDYFKNNDINTDLVYLPLFWTGYHVRNNWGSPTVNKNLSKLT